MLSLAERREARARIEVIAREAAAILERGFRKPIRSLEFKGEIDLVTEFDKASEAHIRARFAREFPAWDVIAEEGGGTASGERPIVYCDPLDGTTNFSHGHPFFAVSIAVMCAGQIDIGVVHAPALRWEYSAARELGATRNGEACRVSRIERLDRALLATGFPYDRRTSEQNNLRAFVEMKKRYAQGIRRCGAAAIDLCLVADGTYEGYWEHKLQPWDLAAGALMVSESGGRITAFDGGAANVVQGELVASNGQVHDALLAALRDVESLPPL